MDGGLLRRSGRVSRAVARGSAFLFLLLFFLFFLLLFFLFLLLFLFLFLLLFFLFLLFLFSPSSIGLRRLALGLATRRASGTLRRGEARRGVRGLGRRGGRR